jgi:multiple sugar transport system substrate-binding protein
VIIRHRRRGTFVNPHWRQRGSGNRELRVIVPEGPWERLLHDAAPEGLALNVATVELADLHQTLVHAVAAGRAPDLAVMDIVWVPEFAAAGFLLPLDDVDPRWVAEEYESDFVEAFVEATRFDGHTVAVPAEADVAGIWFRRSTLADTGVEALSEWKDIQTVGQALVGAVPDPVVLPGGSRAGETASYFLLAFLASNGVAVIEDGRVTLDQPATVECLGFLRQLVLDGIVPEEVVTYEWDRPIRRLGQGQAGLCFGGSYEAPALAAAAGITTDDVAAEFGFVGIPSGPRGGAPTLAGAMVHGVFRQAADPRLAVRLLRSLVTPEALAAMSRTTGQLPSRRAAFGVVAAESPFQAETLRLLNQAVVRPATAAYPQVSAQLRGMLEATLVGQLTPADACRRAAQMIEAITGLPTDRTD